MKILDRYIILKYISTFFFCLLLLTAIIVVIDISEHTDDFSKIDLTAAEITKQYYFGLIPRLDAMFFPLFVFISVIFFTSKMAGRSEVIAILSSGISYRRYLLPFLIAAAMLAAVLWLGYRYAVPPANKRFSDFHRNYLDKHSSLTAADNPSYKQNIFFRIDRENFLGIKSYDTITRTGNGFFIQQFKGNKLSYNLRASNFNWDTAAKTWRLTNAVERTFGDINEKVVTLPAKLIRYNFKPIDLRKDDYMKDEMITPDLDKFIAMEKIRGSSTLSTLLVERYNRDAIPASVFILTIIGVVLASRKIRGGSGAHIALGVVLSMVYILFSRFAEVFATKGNFTPILAAWMPNIIFGLLAFWLLAKRAK